MTNTNNARPARNDSTTCIVCPKRSPSWRRRVIIFFTPSDNPALDVHVVSIDRAPKGTPISKSHRVYVNGKHVADASSRSNALDAAALCRRALEAAGLEPTRTIDRA